MYEAKRIIGVAGLIALVLLGAILFAALPPCGALAASAAADKTTASPKVQALMKALAEEWLDEQGVKNPAAAPPVRQTDDSVDYLSASAGAIHDQIMALAEAAPALPHEFERAIDQITAVNADFDQPEFLLSLGIFGDRYFYATRYLAAETKAVLNLAIFLAFGFGAQWLFRKLTRRARRHLDGLPMETVKDRLHVIAARIALAFGAIAAFVVGSIVPLLALD